MNIIQKIIHAIKFRIRFGVFPSVLKGSKLHNVDELHKKVEKEKLRSSS